MLVPDPCSAYRKDKGHSLYAPRRCLQGVCKNTCPHPALYNSGCQFYRNKSIKSFLKIPLNSLLILTIIELNRKKVKKQLSF